MDAHLGLKVTDANKTLEVKQFFLSFFNFFLSLNALHTKKKIAVYLNNDKVIDLIYL